LRFIFFIRARRSSSHDEIGVDQAHRPEQASFFRFVAGHSGAFEKRALLLTRRSKAFNEGWHELSSRDLAALETGWDG
jgi:hypothetical protein